LASDHVRPLGFLVPVQLADPAGRQAHVDAGDLGRDRQLAGGDLARPATTEDPVVRQRVGVLEVRHGAGIRRRRDQGVGVLPVDVDVARTEDGRAAPSMMG
jgi:hypothetical protein